MIDPAQIDTWPGQAHFADPNSKHTCRECEHWVQAERTKSGRLTVGRCRKARLGAPKFPHSAWSCRHFEANPYAPEV